MTNIPVSKVTKFGFKDWISVAAIILLIGLIFWFTWVYFSKPGTDNNVEAKGLNISGKWRTTFWEDKTESHENITVRHKGDAVEGDIEHLSSKNPGEVANKYIFKGKFADRVLAATYESEDPTEFEQGAFVLDLRMDKKFEGVVVFFSEIKNRIDNSNYIWERIKGK